MTPKSPMTCSSISVAAFAGSPGTANAIERDAVYSAVTCAVMLVNLVAELVEECNKYNHSSYSG